MSNRNQKKQKKRRKKMENTKNIFTIAAEMPLSYEGCELLVNEMFKNLEPRDFRLLVEDIFDTSRNALFKRKLEKQHSA